MKRIRTSGTVTAVASVLMGVLAIALAQSAAARATPVPDSSQVIDQGLSDQPGYAGAWVDSEGRTQVNFTQARAAAGRQASVQAAKGALGPSTVRAVTYDLKQLNALATQAQSALARAGLSATANAEVDIPGNGVRVSVVPAKAAVARKAVRAIAATTVVEDSTASAVPVDVACTDRLNCGAPLRGGIRIGSGSTGCSAGFTATASDTSRWLLTAGHCGPVDSNWTHGEQAIGPIRQVANGLWYDANVDRSVRVDVARIRIDSTYWKQAAGGWLYNTASSTYPVKAAVAAQAVPVGSTVCRSSYSRFHTESAAKCGKVVTSFDRNGYITVSGMVVCSGDSGGAVYYENSTGKHAFALISAIYGPDGSEEECVQPGFHSALSGISSIYHWLDANNGTTIRVDTQ